MCSCEYGVEASGRGARVLSSAPGFPPSVPTAAASDPQAGSSGRWVERRAAAGSCVNLKSFPALRDPSEELHLTLSLLGVHIGGKSPDGLRPGSTQQLDFKGTELCSEEETHALKRLEQSLGPPRGRPAGRAALQRNLVENPRGCPAGLLFAFGVFWTSLGLPLPLTCGPSSCPLPTPSPVLFVPAPLRRW